MSSSAIGRAGMPWVERGEVGLLDPHEKDKREPLVELVKTYIARPDAAGQNPRHLVGERERLLLAFAEMQVTTFLDIVGTTGNEAMPRGCWSRDDDVGVVRPCTRTSPRRATLVEPHDRATGGHPEPRRHGRHSFVGSSPAKAGESTRTGRDQPALLRNSGRLRSDSGPSSSASARPTLAIQ